MECLRCFIVVPLKKYSSTVVMLCLTRQYPADTVELFQGIPHQVRYDSRRVFLSRISIARFKRKTKCYSKSVEMIVISLNLLIK